MTEIPYGGALEIAAAGGHNMVMVGPPGAGKSMLAQRLVRLRRERAAAQLLHHRILAAHMLAKRLGEGNPPTREVRHVLWPCARHQLGEFLHLSAQTIMVVP